MVRGHNGGRPSRFEEGVYSSLPLGPSLLQLITTIDRKPFAMHVPTRLKSNGMELTIINAKPTGWRHTIRIHQSWSYILTWCLHWSDSDEPGHVIHWMNVLPTEWPTRSINVVISWPRVMILFIARLLNINYLLFRFMCGSYAQWQHCRSSDARATY